MNKYGLVSVVLLAPVLAFGCAKQPATMTTAAPAPTGVAVVSPTPSAESTQPTGRFETTPPGADQRGADQRGGATASGATASGTRPAPGEFVGVRDLVDIHFDFDKYAIRPRDAEILEANARWLRANKDAQVLIEGHCDERGTEEYNLSLGDRRAKATVDYLVAQGIAPARLVTISYGKERPQCSEHNEACWAKNRRAHFLVKRG
jgi:peptidoglycan-associated lipoprotein